MPTSAPSHSHAPRSPLPWTSPPPASSPAAPTVAPLGSATNTTTATTRSWHASGNTNAAIVVIGMTNGCKNMVTCTEDGNVSIWDLASGLLAASFWIGGGAVTDATVLKKSAAAVTRDRNDGAGFTFRGGEDWRGREGRSDRVSLLARVGRRPGPRMPSPLAPRLHPRRWRERGEEGREGEREN
uniref:Uncharacterized protein n=1 Tax=Oryza brachyantha TaxID=4533 RepID=J3LCZ5_ORYBR